MVVVWWSLVCTWCEFGGGCWSALGVSLVVVVFADLCVHFVVVVCLLIFAWCRLVVFCWYKFDVHRVEFLFS